MIRSSTASVRPTHARVLARRRVLAPCRAAGPGDLYGLLAEMVGEWG
jgi:hypothetical protein